VGMEFPIYLKVSDTNTLYKITNDHSFTEIKTLGDFYFVNEISDDILPMRNYIMDLVEGEGVEKVLEEEFDVEFEKIKLEKSFRNS